MLHPSSTARAVTAFGDVTRCQRVRAAHGIFGKRRASNLIAASHSIRVNPSRGAPIRSQTSLRNHIQPVSVSSPTHTVSAHTDHFTITDLRTHNASRYHYIFLRDHCPSNIHPSSHQKLVTAGAVKPYIAPLSFSISESGIKVDWNDSHSSAFDWRRLETLEYDQDRRLIQDAPRLTSWDMSNLPSDKITHQYESEGLSKSVITNLITYGLARIKNAPSLLAIARTISNISQHATDQETLSKTRRTIYGDTWDVISKPDAENIAYTGEHLQPHMDLMYYESPPGVQILHCLQNDATGGLSTFVDAIECVHRLSPTSRDILTSFPVEYRYDVNGHWMSYTRPILDVLKDDPIAGNIYYSPQFQAPLRHFAKFANVPRTYEAIREFEDLTTAEEMTWSFRLEPGDTVVFDNRRVLHGRTRFDPQSGGRHLKGTYLDWDEVLNKGRRVFGMNLQKQLLPFKRPNE